MNPSMCSSTLPNKSISIKKNIKREREKVLEKEKEGQRERESEGERRGMTETKKERW